MVPPFIQGSRICAGKALSQLAWKCSWLECVTQSLLGYTNSSLGQRWFWRGMFSIKPVLHFTWLNVHICCGKIYMSNLFVKLLSVATSCDVNSSTVTVPLWIDRLFALDPLMSWQSYQEWESLIYIEKGV